MAIALYLISPRSFAGKSVLTLALGTDAKQRGKTLRYFKPIGPYPVQSHGTVSDQDALYLSHVLGSDVPPDVLCPVPLTPAFHAQVLSGTVSDLLPRVKEAYAKVSEGVDLVFVGGMGSLFSTGMAYGLPSWTIADALDAHALIVTRYEQERSVDAVLAARCLLGDRLLGVVLNAVRPGQWDFVASSVMPFLEERGVPAFGALPEDPVLNAIPISELVTALNARVLVGEEYLDDLVERIAIGAMNEEAALSHFRKMTNKAVVTGGDRSDIQRAALETSTKALILTGGIYPANIILSTAMQRQVPVLLVQDDTLTTIEKVEQIAGQLRIRQPRKVDRAQELVRAHIDLDRLWRLAGIDG